MWRVPIRLPGGLIYQFGQWYAVGPDDQGVDRVGVGDTRAEARTSLARCVNTIRRYYAEKERNER